MKIHARFRLTETARVQYWKGGEIAKVQLQAVQGEPFGDATPQGNIQMHIVNPEAVKVFVDAPIGQEFDVFFSLVKPAEEA